MLSLFIVVFVGAAAFALRQRSPDVYGIVEVVFGAITATLALTQYAAHSSANSELAKHASDMMPDTAKYAFAAFSGLYVIVRGLDNLGKYALSDSVKETYFGKCWRWLFVSSKPEHKPNVKTEPTLSASGQVNQGN